MHYTNALFSKLLLVLLCRIVHGAYYEELYAKLKSKYAASFHNESGVHWEFGMNPCFLGKTEEYLKMLAKAKTSKPSALPSRTFTEAELKEPLPTQFDAREQWPHCSTIKYIKDQSNCGSCWAVSSASVMSDRYCIKNGTKDMVFVSEEELISCCKICGLGCDGGFPEKAFVYWATRGIPTGGPWNQFSCKPYSIKPCAFCSATAPTPTCQNECSANYTNQLSADRTFGSKAYSLNNEYDIMREIYLNGPVVGTFLVYDDLFYYKTGVYRHSYWANVVGAHAVRIIGWGVNKKVPYWIIANSWSESFGLNGILWMLRGNNECDIERDIVASNPKTVLPAETVNLHIAT